MNKQAVEAFARAATTHIKSENKEAKFWLTVLAELQNRGIKDILIACIDSLTAIHRPFNDSPKHIYCGGRDLSI